MKPDHRKYVDLSRLQEFREGAREFIEAVSECPICSIKLALELTDSDNPYDKILLKRILIGLGETLLEQQQDSRFILSIFNEKRFPLIRGWLKGEIGLGLGKLIGGRKID